MSISSIQDSQITASQSDAAKTSLSDDLDTFLILLTAQLQNQDPLSPLETAEFTNQLVAFADVEQSIAQSGYLEDLITLQKSNEVTNAVSYIGKTVEVESDEFYMKEGDGATFSYVLPEAAKASTLTITNSDGDVVYIGEASTTAGEHVYNWDGKKEDGTSFPTDAYAINVAAVNPDSQPIEGIAYFTTGKITGIEYGDTKTTLIMGSIGIDIGRITAVVEDDA